MVSGKKRMVDIKFKELFLIIYDKGFSLTVYDYLQCKGKKQLSVLFVHNVELQFQT